MDIILLDKVGRLGAIGDKVSVKSGYARNFLLPQGKAVAATAKKTSLILKSVVLASKPPLLQKSLEQLLVLRNWLS